MKTLLLNLMGTSPMVATEMYAYLKNEHINDIILLYTSNKYVEAGTMAAKASLENNFGVNVHLSKLKFEDILGRNELIMFIDQLAKIIKTERENYNIDKIIINVSGGRKIETIILSIYSSIFGFDEVYNIINKNIQNYNEKYEMIRDKILEFNGTSNDSELYKKYQHLIDPIFYPDMNDLYFLRVPVVKLPEDEINKIKTALSSTMIEDSELEDYRLNAYRDSGFITYDKTRIYITELGKIILDYMK